MSLGSQTEPPFKATYPQGNKHIKLPPDTAHDEKTSERLEELFHPPGQSRGASASKSGPQRRLRSPGLKWHKQYETRRTGRVLVIDYIKKECSKEGMRKVAAQEINNIEGLRKIYISPDRGDDAVLRVFHVQNATWAAHFLLRKFNISARDDLVGTDFGHYVQNTHRQRRGKPLLTGKSWKTTHDPVRNPIFLEPRHHSRFDIGRIEDMLTRASASGEPSIALALVLTISNRTKSVHRARAGETRLAR